MAGSITVSSITLDSDNNFSIKSNTGATLFSANTSGIVSGVQNTAISGVITGTQLATGAANTNLGYNPANKAGDTFTGYVEVGNTVRVTSISNPASGSGMEFAYDGTQGVIQAYSNRATLASVPVYLGTGQLKFPATQVASSDANTLDDYEEGTWTPIDGSGAGLSFSVTSANYRKIGSMVFVNLYMTYPSTSDATSANIAGLPFAAASGNQYSYMMGRIQANLGNMLVWQAQASGTAMAANWGWNSASATPTNAQLSGSFLLISGWYIAAN